MAGRLTPSKIRFTQQMHSCGDTDREATMTFEVKDAGGGPYVVLSADEWSLDVDDDAHAEVNVIAEALHQFIDQARGREVGRGSEGWAKGEAMRGIPIGSARLVPEGEVNESMGLAEYERFVKGMWQHNNTMTQTEQKHHAGLGLAEEAGEVVGLLKKAHNGNPLPKAALASEAGDVLFYLSTELRLHGLTLQDAIGANVQKLAKRLNEGSLVDLSKRDTGHTIQEKVVSPSAHRKPDVDKGGYCSNWGGSPMYCDCRG